MGRRVMIFAGEASGDMYGGRLARALRECRPGIELSGIGGDEMAAAGVRLVTHIRDLSVMGIWEVIRDLGRLRRILNLAKGSIRRETPDALVLIDFFRFNIELGRAAKKAGIPVIYYVAPKLWAWGEGRVHRLRRSVDGVLAIFPFEEEFYRSHSVPVTFVGNPLVELLDMGDPSPLMAQLGLHPEDTVISLLPGSRASEVKQLLPAFLAAAELVSRELDRRVRFLMPLAHTVPRNLVDDMLADAGVVVTLTEGESRNLLKLSSVALVASGTATLEAFLLGVPQVVAYRTSWVTSFIGRRLIRIPRISLPNILAGRDVVEELLQEEVMPERLARAVLELLSGKGHMDDYLDASREVRQSLKGEEASTLAAAAVLEAMDSGAAGRLG
ncbi:MAG: lipid-A-disaccharide synthase [bacterium]|nr:MAG: lipid-A-disaccharide synthase [bacterium]